MKKKINNMNNYFYTSRTITQKLPLIKYDTKEQIDLVEKASNRKHMNHEDRFLKLFLALILVIILMCFNIAYAQDVRVVIVNRTDISNASQLAIARAGVTRVNELAKKVRVRDVKIIPDYLQLNKLSDYKNRGVKWHNYLVKKKIIPNDKLIELLLLPPVYDKGIDFGGGVALQCSAGAGNGHAYAIAREKNVYGEARQLSSVTAVAHELAHTLGAYHEDSIGCLAGSPGCTSCAYSKLFKAPVCSKTNVNIMHSNALAFGNITLPWDRFNTPWYVDSCLKNRGYKKRALNKSVYDEPTH
jgi:hypothetical protein